MGAAWLYRKTPIEVRPILGQKGVAGLEAREVPQTQLLDQTVLQGLDDPLNPSFGL